MTIDFVPFFLSGPSAGGGGRLGGRGAAVLPSCCVCLLLTPPLMLGFERANLDFALFLLCAIAARQWSRVQGEGGLTWPIAGLVVGALLKLYPVFAILGAALAERGRCRTLWLLSAGAIFGYWAWNAEEMGLIAQKIPVATSASWGCLILFARLERFLGEDPSAFVWLATVKWPLVALLTYGAGLLVAVGVGRWLSRRMKSARWMPREWCYYWTGAAICCGSFAGANFAYRWIFVILTLPLLIRFSYQPDRWMALWARFTLFMLIVSLISPLSAGRGVFLVSQAANWACILSLVAGAVALRLVSHHPSRSPIRSVDALPRQRSYPPAFPPLGFPEGAPAGQAAAERA